MGCLAPLTLDLGFPLGLQGNDAGGKRPGCGGRVDLSIEDDQPDVHLLAVKGRVLPVADATEGPVLLGNHNAIAGLGCPEQFLTSRPIHPVDLEGRLADVLVDLPQVKASLPEIALAVCQADRSLPFRAQLLLVSGNTNVNVCRGHGTSPLKKGSPIELNGPGTTPAVDNTLPLQCIQVALDSIRTLDLELVAQLPDGRLSAMPVNLAGYVP
jgi:hypothetical protein